MSSIFKIFDRPIPKPSNNNKGVDRPAGGISRRRFLGLSLVGLGAFCVPKITFLSGCAQPGALEDILENEGANLTPNGIQLKLPNKVDKRFIEIGPVNIKMDNLVGLDENSPLIIEIGTDSTRINNNYDACINGLFDPYDLNAKSLNLSIVSISIEDNKEFAPAYSKDTEDLEKYALGSFCDEKGALPPPATFTLSPAFLKKGNFDATLTLTLLADMTGWDGNEEALKEYTNLLFVRARRPAQEENA